MAVSKINGNKNASVVTVTFTSAGYGLWTASTKTTHRILQAVAPNYFISGDGSDYCGLIKRSSTAVEPAPASDSPITMDCLAIPR